MPTSVLINFSRPFPLFPLPETVVLPHTVQMLHVTEPRYRAMIDLALDNSGQLALATWNRDDDVSLSKNSFKRSVRDAVCLVQIMHHESVPDGYEIVLHGVCRARISELEQETTDRPWCRVKVQPLEQLTEQPPPMYGLREELYQLLTRDHLVGLNRVDAVIEWFDRDDVSTHTLLELIGFTFINDSERRYRLLAEPTIDGRTRIIRSELVHLDRLIGQARLQQRDDLERGTMIN